MRPAGRTQATVAACCIAASIILGIFANVRVVTAVPAFAPSAQPTGSRCLATTSAVAWPPSVTLGQTLEVGLGVWFECPSEWLPIHLVLVLDGSSSTPRGSLFAMKRAAHAIVDSLDFETFPGNRVGVVEFKTRASIHCELTDDRPKITSCIERVDSSGGRAIDQGIRRAMQVLRTGRGDEPASAFREIIIVFGDGMNIVGCDPVAAEAARAKGQDVQMLTVCLILGCDVACFERTATSKRHMFDIVDVDALVEHVSSSVTETVTVNPISMELSISIAANMPYVPGSALPPADETSLAERRIDWLLPMVGRTDAYIVLDVRPSEMGDHPVGVSATGTLRDSLERRRSFEFALPIAQVMPPKPESSTPVERSLLERPIYIPLTTKP